MACYSVSFGFFTFSSMPNGFFQKKKILYAFLFDVSTYRGADKSLALPGRKQATVTEDFDVHISYL